MKGKKKIELGKRVMKSDRKINQKNKTLMIDKILSYNPIIIEGIEAYKDANRDFTLLIVLGILLIDFPIISVPCCILSMFFLMKMLQFIRFKSINNIVIKLAKDLSFKGIYNKEKAENMLEDFKSKYGENIIEYEELIKMLDKYETLVTKIELALRNINKKKEKNHNNEDSTALKKNKDNQYNNIEINDYCKDINEKLSVLYKEEDGNVKKINKAIEFFDNEDNESYNNQSTVVLKNINRDNKKLIIYLYKKSSNLQKNAL